MSSRIEIQPDLVVVNPAKGDAIYPIIGWTEHADPIVLRDHHASVCERWRYPIVDAETAGRFFASATTISKARTRRAVIRPRPLHYQRWLTTLLSDRSGNWIHPHDFAHDAVQDADMPKVCSGSLRGYYRIKRYLEGLGKICDGVLLGHALAFRAYRRYCREMTA